MSDRDHRFQQFALAVAKAMFSERLHVLRLTEVVRLQIRPNEDGNMVLPRELDEELKKQAWDFVMTMVPSDFHVDLLQLKSSWLTPQ